MKLNQLVTTLILTAFTLISSDTLAQDSFSLRDQDKQLHLISSYALNLSMYKIVNKYVVKDKTAAMLVSSLLTLGIGVTKELCDKQFSWGDMQANSIGIGLSIGFVLLID